MRIVKTPSVLKHLFPSYIWNIKTNKKVVYLTFDDGPTPKITEQVLQILNTYKAKATFFCIGKNIHENQEILKKIVAEKHTIGNHTYNHLKGWETNTQEYINDTIKAEEIIQQLSPSSAQQKLFRPPYGRIKPQQAKQLQKLGYKIITWDVLSYDWDAQVSKEQVVKNIVNNTKPGSIIVLHDSNKAAINMLYALPKVLEYFTEKGYTFEALNFDHSQNRKPS